MQSSLHLVNQLHDDYCSRSGHEIELNMHRERVWSEWLRWRKTPFTREDLARVIALLRKKISSGWDARALGFTNLIGNPDKFEEYLAEARASALQRQSVPTKQGTYKPIEAPKPEDRATLDDFTEQMKQHKLRR